MHCGNSQYMSQQYQNQISKQDQLVDQNYAILNFMMLLSTFQSLTLKFASNNSTPTSEKRYKQYDYCDFSQKSLNQLKDQAQTQLFAFETSKLLFSKKYGPNQYILPNSFNSERVKEQLQLFRKIFEFNQQLDCVQMLKQTYSIMFQNPPQFIVQQRNFGFQDEGLLTQQKKHSLFSQASLGGQLMKDQAKSFKQKGIQKAQDIPIHVQKCSQTSSYVQE